MARTTKVRGHKRQGKPVRKHTRKVKKRSLSPKQQKEYDQIIAEDLRRERGYERAKADPTGIYKYFEELSDTMGGEVKKNKVKKRSLDPKEIKELTFQAMKDVTKRPMSPDISETKREIIKYDFVPGKGLVRKRRMLVPYGKKTFGQKISSIQWESPDREYTTVGMTQGMKKELRKKGLLD